MPRVSEIILLSVFITGSSLAFVNSVGVNALHVANDGFRDSLKSAIDDDWMLIPTILTLACAVIALVLSFYVIYRARKIGSAVLSIDGILHHHDQINISMRVATLHTFLSPFAEMMSPEKLNEAFFEGGARTGKKFGVAFPETYRTRIKRGALDDWDSLSLRQKLLHWERYDQQSGWGDIRVILEGTRIEIQILHPLLFRNKIGDAWAHFMKGYILALLNEISKPRGRVTFDDSAGVDNQGEYITLHYLTA